MRKLIAAFLSLFLFACASTKTDAPLQVMTWNLRLNLASDGPNAWPNRKDVVARMIREQQADLLGVQEALPDQLADLDRGLPDHARFGVGRTAERSGEHSAIFYRQDRFDLLESDTFWLSETPRVAGSKGWDAAYERIVTWGKLRDRKTGTIFFHFNTHLDHVGVVARREGTKLLIAELQRIAGDVPVILTGDFNTVPDSEPYQIVVASGLVDAFTATREPHRGPTSTWNAFKAIETDRRIDFIFVRGFVVTSHAILPDTVDGRFPSDHLPVVAKFQLGYRP